MARQQGFLPIPFPISGLNVIAGRTNQPDLTAANCVNVRPFDLLEGRARGGIRPGLDTYLTNTFDGGGRIQDINYATLVRDAPPTLGALYVRETKAVAVSNGTIQQFNSAGINTANTTGNAVLVANAPFIMSAELYGHIYYCDGYDYKEWVGQNNVAQDWSVAAPGALPGDPGNTACRIIEKWDGRICMAGLRSDPHQYFMSGKGDPNDFDYSPQNTTELQAVTGSVGLVGSLEGTIQCMIPYSDDILIFGCDHSMWQMSGNPMAGGRIDNISHNIGLPYGRPWCRDPEGNVYFFSNRGDVYKMPPYGAKPASISDAIHPRLDQVDLNTTFCRMEWDDEAHGCKLWLTPIGNAAASIHYFFDARTGGWFPFQYANTAYNPIAVKLFDGDAVDDRVVLIGSEDGKVRFDNTSKVTDSGTAFPATYTIGPVASGKNSMGRAQRSILTGIAARTDVNSSTVSYEVLYGDTAEASQRSEDATFSGDGTFTPGMSPTSNPMMGGYYLYVKVGTAAAATAWAIEELNLTLASVVSDAGRLTN